MSNAFYFNAVFLSYHTMSCDKSVLSKDLSIYLFSAQSDVRLYAELDLFTHTSRSYLPNFHRAKFSLNFRRISP